MMPIARPVTAMAATSISRLLHSGIKANTTEMMNVDATRDDKEEQSLERRDGQRSVYGRQDNLNSLMGSNNILIVVTLRWFRRVRRQPQTDLVTAVTKKNIKDCGVKTKQF